MEASQAKHYASELTLCDGVNVYHIFHPNVVPGPDDTPYTFQNQSEVETLLDRHMNVRGEFQLASFLNTRGIPVRNMHSRRDRIESLSRYIMKRPVIITPHMPPEKKAENVVDTTERDTREVLIPGDLRAHTQHIDFRFIDAKTGKPVPGIRARIIHDDGSHQDLVSGRHGYISRENLSPGTCTLFSDPGEIPNLTVEKTVTPLTGGKASRSLYDKETTTWPPARAYLCRVLEYKVKDGDTLSSIAESHGLSLDELARFNWGISDRKKALPAMKRDTGCTRETETGDDCLFESTNTPGIVFIPQTFEETDFATGTGHIIQVAKTGFDALSDSIYGGPKEKKISSFRSMG